MKIKHLTIILCLGLILTAKELSAESYYDKLPSVEINLEVLDKFKKSKRPPRQAKPRVTRTQPVSQPKPKIEPKPIEKAEKPALPPKPRLPVKPKAEPKPAKVEMPALPKEPKEEPKKTADKPIFPQIPIKPKEEPKKEPKPVQKVETPPALPPKPELPAKPEEAVKPKEKVEPVKIADKPIGPMLPPMPKEEPESAEKKEETLPMITAKPKAKPKVEKPEPKMEPVELEDGKLPWKEEDDSQYQPKLTWDEDEKPKEKSETQEKEKRDMASILEDTKPITPATPLPTLPGKEEVQKPKPKIPEVPNIYDEDGRKLGLRIEFAQSQTGLSPSVENNLQGLVEQLKEEEDKVLIIRSYAGGEKEQASLARRVSLSRAVAVRSYLLENDIDSSRINVRAMGNAYKEPPADRVDIFIDESDF